MSEGKSTFFLHYLSRGFVVLLIIVAFFVFAKHTIRPEMLTRFEPFFENTAMILLLFCLSELIFGIIPPEFFMIWALRGNNPDRYFAWTLLFTFISYAAGLTAFLFGRYLNRTQLYRVIQNRFLQKSETLLQQYGLYLILVASLTPIPFSGVAMIVGSVRYPVKNYAAWSLSRFIKFAVSAYVIWEANMI